MGVTPPALFVLLLVLFALACIALGAGLMWLGMEAAGRFGCADLPQTDPMPGPWIEASDRLAEAAGMVYGDTKPHPVRS